MDLFVITGNKGKFEEIVSLIPYVKQLDIDLPEIQEIDPTKIVEDKLKIASLHHKGGFIIEDTSLYFDGLNGLPGPLVKWFIKSIGNDGLAKIATTLDNNIARAMTLLGYKDINGDMKYFAGEIRGNIVLPRGTNGFGWDAIFQPKGSLKTFAEMSNEEKLTFSMRRVATEKLKKYLDNN